MFANHPSPIFSLNAVPPCFTQFSLKRFLQAQGIMSGILFSILLASPINGFLQWFFVHGPLHLGFIGSPIALSITYTLMPIFFYIYISWFVGWDCWGGWSAKDAFDWGQMKILLSLGLPGLFMICSEWWAFEILALAAGMLVLLLYILLR